MRERADRIVALSAGLIGLAALAISGYQAHIMREQQRTSVWPRIEILVTNAARGFSVTMNNPGIGPALIRFAEVRVDGQARGSWREVLAALGVAGEMSQGKIADRVLSPEQSQEIFAPGDPQAIATLNAQGGRVTLRICYCSIYEECWVAERTLQGGARLTHHEVDGCALEEARRFGQ